jgi:hypothetical protein
VCSGDGNDLLARLQQGDHFGAFHGGEAAQSRLGDFGIVIVRRRGVDNELGVADVHGGVALVHGDA